MLSSYGAFVISAQNPSPLGQSLPFFRFMLFLQKSYFIQFKSEVGLCHFSLERFLFFASEHCMVYHHTFVYFPRQSSPVVFVL